MVELCRIFEGQLQELKTFASARNLKGGMVLLVMHVVMS